MSTIQTFDYETQNLTVEADDYGQLWFRADEICAVLEMTNPREALRKHVDPDDVTKRDAIDSLGRRREVNYINESGLYALILRSHKPKAQGFKRWVTSQVLPEIRRTGAYRPAARADTIEVPRAHYFALVDRLARLPLSALEHPRITKVTREEVTGWRAQNDGGMSKAAIARQTGRHEDTIRRHLNQPRFV